MPDPDEDIDIGPLTLPELHGLARDATLQLRRFWTEILARQPRRDVVSLAPGQRLKIRTRMSIMDLLDMLDAAAKETT
jgi:hypothetical protein